MTASGTQRKSMSKSLSNMFRLDDDLDKRMAFAAIGVSIILLIVNFTTMNSLFNYEVLFTLLFACVVYLLLRRKAHPPSAWLAPPENRQRTKTNLYQFNILFFVLLAVSLVMLHQGLYSRPLAFLAIAAIMAGILAVEIALYRNQGYSVFILLQILILGLLLGASAYYQFPSVVGNDPPYHINFIEQLMAQGKVGDFGDYSGFPGMHIFISSVSLVSGLGLRHSFFFIGIIECLSLVFVFLIGRAISNEKLGLLAALLLGITNQHILWSYYIVPMGFCLALMPMIIFLLFSQEEGHCLGISPDINQLHYSHIPFNISRYTIVYTGWNLDSIARV
jgi:hypothetical protein